MIYKFMFRIFGMTTEMNQKTWLNTNRINEHFHFYTQDVLFIMFFWNIYEFLMLKIPTDFFSLQNSVS